MTIEEIKKLADDEKNGELRVPKSLHGESYDNLMMAHEQMVFIVDKIIRSGNRDRYLSDSMLSKLEMRKIGITGLDILNKDFGSYEIYSKLGDGVFFDAHKLFVGKKYPPFIRSHYCYDNTRSTIAIFGKGAKILSGIVFIGKPFLHSVILFNDTIIDFNYDLVISKDLYFKLTHFEVLAKLNYEQLHRNHEIICNMKGVQSHIFNFAFEEVIEEEKKKQGIDDGVGV